MIDSNESLKVDAVVHFVYCLKQQEQKLLQNVDNYLVHFHPYTENAAF